MAETITVFGLEAERPVPAAEVVAAARENPAAVAALTRQLVAGDEAAWREFHAAYFDRLLRYLFVVTGGREEGAREALQLTFVRAVRHMRRFDAEPVLWSWLTVLARSAVVDEQRKRGRYLAFLDRFFAWHRTESAGPAGDADARLAELLERNLADLDDAERRLVERKYLAGESVRDLAGELGDTEKAVESRLGRVRRKLKDAIVAQLKHEV